MWTLLESNRQNRSNKLFTTLHRAGEQNRTVILCLEGKRTNRCATPAKNNNRETSKQLFVYQFLKGICSNRLS